MRDPFGVIPRLGHEEPAAARMAAEPRDPAEVAAWPGRGSVTNAASQRAARDAAANIVRLPQQTPRVRG
jgi:hypothetical protein